MWTRRQRFDMRLIRARLVTLAFGLVVCQFSVFPASLYRLGRQAGAESAVCTCNHGVSSQCPMHKDSRPSNRPASGSRWCGEAHHNQAVVLATFVASLGIPVARHQIAMPSTSPEPLVFTSGRPTDLTTPPLFPPPRG